MTSSKNRKQQNQKGNNKAKKSPIFNTLDKLHREDKLVDNTVTFYLKDGRRLVQKISKKFMVSDRGRPKNTNDILQDLNAKAWDLQASHFAF